MDKTLGETKLRRVNSPNELIVGQKYFYVEAEMDQLYQFKVNGAINMDFIPKRFLCRKMLIYEGIGFREGIYNFKIIEDSPSTCSRERISSVGETLMMFDELFYPSNNEQRLYHSKIVPEPAIGAGKKCRTKRLKSKRRRTRKNKRKSSLRKK